MKEKASRIIIIKAIGFLCVLRAFNALIFISKGYIRNGKYFLGSSYYYQEIVRLALFCVLAILLLTWQAVMIRKSGISRRHYDNPDSMRYFFLRDLMYSAIGVILIVYNLPSFFEALIFSKSYKDPIFRLDMKIFCVYFVVGIFMFLSIKGILSLIFKLRRT